ncbi:hypothetical protein EYF80_032077 [Liparis tanakae]|uniref:Uncharacterized protein n=1 Tax=Liparis tanakae TaxID=230148 RepID=A0A4Z2GW73_9TELE|nr:hypothetical protein EYF80_032077 [Liparis tanakae]
MRIKEIQRRSDPIPVVSDPLMHVSSRLNFLPLGLWQQVLATCAAVLLAGQAHRGGVDDGHEPLHVRQQHPVEELLVAVLEPHQEHISGEDKHAAR